MILLNLKTELLHWLTSKARRESCLRHSFLKTLNVRKDNSLKRLIDLNFRGKTRLKAAQVVKAQNLKENELY
jgi:hypothetical protein